MTRLRHQQVETDLSDGAKAGTAAGAGVQQARWDPRELGVWGGLVPRGQNPKRWDS